MNRDLKADREICAHFNKLVKQGVYEMGSPATHESVREILKFALAANEGWPHAIERAIKAEALAREACEGGFVMKSYVFNDKRGNRDRKCFFCVVYEGKAYSMKEAEDAGLAVFRSLKYEQAGKWSNTTWEVTLNSASLIVFMEPFDGWNDKIEDVILEVKESCYNYISYEPTDVEAIIAFQHCCPGRYARRMEKEEKIINLI